MAPIHEAGGTETSNIYNNSNSNSDLKLNKSETDQRFIDITKIDLSTRIHVNRSKEAFGSFGESLVDLPTGAVFAPIVGSTPGAKAYSSIQVSPDAHVELNSDLLYCNHSCAPALEFDVSQMLVRVSRDRPLRKGDKLTFWYPSTEWEMAQPFLCTCGAGKNDYVNGNLEPFDPDDGVKGEQQTTETLNTTTTHNATTINKTQKCKGWISGAKDMDETILRQYWLNEHIEKLLAERNEELEENGGGGGTQRQGGRQG